MRPQPVEIVEKGATLPIAPFSDIACVKSLSPSGFSGVVSRRRSSGLGSLQVAYSLDSCSYAPRKAVTKLPGKAESNATLTVSSKGDMLIRLAPIGCLSALSVLCVQVYRL